MGRLLVLVLRRKVISILTGVYEESLGELTFPNVAWRQAALLFESHCYIVIFIE